MNGIRRVPESQVRRGRIWEGQLVILGILLIAGACTKEGPAGPSGPAGEYSLVDPAVQPAVIRTVPAEGETGPCGLFEPGAGENRPHFILQFNKLMIAGTVQAAVKGEGFNQSVSIYNRVRSSYDNVFPFGLGLTGPPIDCDCPPSCLGTSEAIWPYRVGQTYAVTVDTTAEDVNGNRLSRPFRVSFTPEPYFRVTASFPPGGSAGHDHEVQPSITFNSAIDTSILSFLAITPPVRGQWSLKPRTCSSETYAAVFRPADGLPSNASVTISVGAGARDLFGNEIHRPFAAVFTVQPFQIIGTDPGNGDVNVPSGVSITLRFSAAIDTGSARAAFTLSPGRPWTLIPTDRTVTVYPDGELACDAEYTATVSTALRAKDGTPLASPYTFSFRTISFQTQWLFPGNGDTAVSEYGAIEARFNATIDTSTARQAFSITPYVPGEFRFIPYGFLYLPRPALTGGTDYVVTVSTALRSSAGSGLETPSVSAFRTLYQQLAVVSTAPEDGATNVHRAEWVYVYCSTLLDTASIRRAFSITPHVPGVLRVFDDESWFRFERGTIFEASTEYTVTLSAALRSKSGSPLLEPYVFRFRTAE